MESTAVEILSVSTGTPNEGSLISAAILICVGLDKFIVEEISEGWECTAAGEMSSVGSESLSSLAAMSDY